MQVVRGGRVVCSKYSAAPATWVGLRRGRSYAASLPSPSDSPKRKRVSKDERRALIESFVTRYRSMNAGKFPSVTAAQKEVGGSYYVVRKILQELEYKSNLCSSKSSYENLSAKVVSGEDKSFSVVEVVSTGHGVQDDTSAEAMDNVKMPETNNKPLEADRVLQAYTSAGETFYEGFVNPQIPGSHRHFVLEENCMLKVDAKSPQKQEDDKVDDVEIDSSDKFLIFPDKQKIVEASDQDLQSEELHKNESQGVLSDFGVVKGDLLKEETEFGNEEGDQREQTVSKELLSSGNAQHKAEDDQQFSDEEKHARNLSSKQIDDAESLKKSTLWGNLKSFADGIINIWRRL